jgi:glucan biosynthesis protein C
MTLGVVLHAGQVFSPESTWLIHSPWTTPVATSLISIIHVFRMPAFYIVSGFFALLTLKKYGTSMFLKLRAEKILIPFVVTAVVLNSLQAWLLRSQAPGPSDDFDLSRYLWEGEWVSHLWFLGYLFAFVLLIVAGATLLKLFPRPLPSFSARWKWPSIELLVLVLPVYYLGLVIVGKFMPVIFQFRVGFSLYDLLYYLQFFVFGVALCRSKSLFERFTQISFLKCGALIGFWLLLKSIETSGGEVLGKVLEAYSRLLIVWISCHMIFSLFKQWADRPSKLATFTSSASYTVYLFHHSLVILFGLLCIHWGLGGLPGFVFLTVVVALLGAGIHVVFISRYHWASYLFNGVRLRRDRKTFP